VIYFKYVRWRNLLSTGNTFTEIQLNKNPTTLIIGENGAGKSTTLKALIGLLTQRSGRITFMGQDISGYAPHEACRLGLGFVPEDRRIFTDLDRHQTDHARRGAR